MASKKRGLTPENLTKLQKQYLIPKLRQITRYWPYNNETRKQSKTKVQIGTYKNGKPKYKNKYKCAKCGELFDKIAIDHKDPVIPIDSNGITWDDYINRLFCDTSNLQSLCNYPGEQNGRKSCHAIKTENEQIQRRAHKTRKNKMSN
jgi:hypothetical protein